MDAIKSRITEWASHVRGYDQIGAVANCVEGGIAAHHAKGLECEAAWRAIEGAVVSEIAKELHRMRVVLNGGDAMRDYVRERMAELRGCTGDFTGPVGVPGERDPDYPCAEFLPGKPDGDCASDGHYLCQECEHLDGSQGEGGA